MRVILGLTGWDDIWTHVATKDGDDATTEDPSDSEVPRMQRVQLGDWILSAARRSVIFASITTGAQSQHHRRPMAEGNNSEHCCRSDSSCAAFQRLSDSLR